MLLVRSAVTTYSRVGTRRLLTFLYASERFGQSEAVDVAVLRALIITF